MSQIFIFYILSQFSKCCILIIINFRQNGPPPPLLSTSVLKTGFVLFIDIHAFLYICKKIISLLEPQISQHNAHCLKIVQLRSNFWSVFSRVRTEYGVRMRENTDQKLLRIWTLHAVAKH